MWQSAEDGEKGTDGDEKEERRGGFRVTKLMLASLAHKLMLAIWLTSDTFQTQARSYRTITPVSSVELFYSQRTVLSLLS